MNSQLITDFNIEFPDKEIPLNNFNTCIINFFNKKSDILSTELFNEYLFFLDYINAIPEEFKKFASLITNENIHNLTILNEKTNISNYFLLFLPYEIASKQQHYNDIEWILYNKNFIIENQRNDILMKYIMFEYDGHYLWVINNEPIIFSSNKSFFNKAFEWASQNGHLGIVQYLIE